jgi:hypothetical protein
MTYYLSNERNKDVLSAFRRYQEYLCAHRREFPPGAYSLATAEWYYDPNDHHCPHDGWLDRVTISEATTPLTTRAITIRTRLLSAYQDGYIEFFYPHVFTYSLDSSSCSSGLGDWLYDEFRLSPQGNVIHEIEWAGLPSGKGSRWIIESSDIEFRWTPVSDSSGG